VGGRRALGGRPDQPAVAAGGPAPGGQAVSIDSPYLIVLGLAGILAAALGWALAWDRWGRFRRSAVIILSVLAVVATAALQLNRMTEAYPSWSALLGGDSQPAQEPQLAAEGPPAGVPAGIPAGAPAGVPAGPPAKPGQSQMLAYSVPGPASGLTLPMYVYLPRGYSTSPHTRYPVIQAAHGFPGTAVTWLRKLHVQRYLDTEIATGRMAPTVVLFPMQTTQALLDTECTDLAHGPKSDTFLTTDVPAFAMANFRVRTDRTGWGLIGYSAGGFCATNLALRHADRYAAAASLSGYASAGIAIGDGTENTYNNPAWRLQHLPQPPVSLFLAWADDDKITRRDSLRLTALAHTPVQITTAVVAHGGHSHTVWEQMEPPAFDWLSAHLARPAEDEPAGG
jgi:enterochelin esterase-like enzyme